MNRTNINVIELDGDKLSSFLFSGEDAMTVKIAAQKYFFDRAIQRGLSDDWVEWAWQIGHYKTDNYSIYYTCPVEL